MNDAEFAVVVSTIGRVDDFRRLVRSVEQSSFAERTELVVVDQSDDGRCAEVLREQPWAMRTRSAESGRGASLGRNTGLGLTGAALVAFPDDDAWYPVETLQRVAERFAREPDLAALCGRQLTDDGRPSMLRWKSKPGPVTHWNFLRTSIMSTMFFRRDWLARVGPFDENMGVGSAGWYGACEESDLLLRVLEADGRVVYDPDVVVHQQEPRDTPDEAFVRKMLLYGCGQGHLWRERRRLSRIQLAYFCTRKLVAAAVRSARGRRTLARADLAWVRGNLAGLLDTHPHELRAPAAHRSVTRAGP